MGRGYAAAKARKQAATAAAAGQGAVAEPVTPRYYDAEAPNPNKEAYVAREIRSAKASERSYDRIADTISISYPQETIGREVLDAAIKMRAAAEQISKRLKQNYKNADSRDGRVRANMGLNSLSLAVTFLDGSTVRVKRVAAKKPNKSDMARSAFEANRDLIRARNDSISAFEEMRRAATSAGLDLAELRNFPFSRFTY